MSRNHFFAAAFSLAFVAGSARAQSEADALHEAAALPIATAAPASLPAAGGDFVVQSAQTSAYATHYNLRRTPDGAHVRIEIAGRGVRHASLSSGARVTAKPISTGAILTAGGVPIAFVPNALGRARLAA